MTKTAIKFENISKQYRLGVVGTGTMSHDLNRWWHAIRGKEDPYLQVGATNDRSIKATSDYIWALRDINFEVKQGDVVGIIGKNGAGKSTLLKLLSRVTSPTTGSIKARGRIASLLEVGTGFHPELTGRENVYMNGAIMGMTKAEITNKLDEIVDFAGVEMYIDTPTKRYSSGMTVRLGFAIAAHLEPEILVVDEVLAVGDAEFQKKAIGKMQDVSMGEGRTVLFVSHNMASIQQLCPKTIVLEDGQLSFEGVTSEAINIYYNKNEDNETPLSERKDRVGTGALRVTKIDVYAMDQSTKQKTQPRLGEDLYLEFSIDRFNKEIIKQFRLDFRLEEGSGVRVAWLSTTLKSVDVLDGDKVTFCIPKCPFNYGRYFITYSCVVGGDTVDWMQNAYKFDVNEGLFYTTSVIVPKEQTSIYNEFSIDIK